MEKLRFGVLDALLKEGLDYYDEVEAKKAAHKAANVAEGKKPKSRKRAGDCLRDRDPW